MDSMAVGDFNGDGKEDLAVANLSTQNVLILLGDGLGAFTVSHNLSVGLNPRSIAVSDFNNDGKQDLAVANYGSNNVSILLGNGIGQFSTATNFGAGTRPESMTVGDFNQDDYQDLAVANAGSNNVSVLLGNGAGSFTPQTNYSVGTAPISLAAGDFDGDGKQDLAVANINSNNVSILSGNGMGRFGIASNFPLGGGAHLLAVGDFNGDARQDIAVTRLANVSILLRDCALTPASIVARKGHGSAGAFDIDLPLTGSPGVECRTSGRPLNDYTIVVTFPSPIAVTGNPQAALTVGIGTIGTNGTSNGGMVLVSGNTITVPLTNVTDAQLANVTLFQLNGSGNMTIPVRLISGDVNGDGTVNTGDALQTRNRSGQSADATNFRSDVNTDGVVNGGDTTVVRARSGGGLP
jgi:hypothetical protein